MFWLYNTSVIFIVTPRRIYFQLYLDLNALLRTKKKKKEMELKLSFIELWFGCSHKNLFIYFISFHFAFVNKIYCISKWNTSSLLTVSTPPGQTRAHKRNRRLQILIWLDKKLADLRKFTYILVTSPCSSPSLGQVLTDM